MVPVPVYIRGKQPQAAFTPASIPGLKLWLDASRITGLVDGDPVATWNDLSGLGNHATQGTGSKRPTYKTGIQNGKPVVRFDGVDDFMAAPCALTQPDTVFMVAKNLGSTSAKDFLDGASTGGRQLFRVASAITVLVYAGGTGFTPAAVPGNWNVYAIRWNGASSILNINGGSDLTGDAGTNNVNGQTFGASTSGVSELANFDMAEFIGYQASLSAVQVAAASSYLRAKWGI